MIKKSFTLIEILVVLVIMGILISIVFRSVKMGDKDIIDAQSCLNEVYGKMRHVLLNSSTSKGIFTGSDGLLKYPEFYSINIDLVNDNIQYTYSGGTSGYGIIKEIKLKGNNEDPLHKCYGKRYNIELTGSDNKFDVDIRLLMEGNNQKPGFVINNQPNTHTGVVYANFCGGEIDDTSNVFCRPLGIFFVDKRIHNIRFIKCFAWSQGGQLCRRRSEIIDGVNN